MAERNFSKLRLVAEDMFMDGKNAKQIAEELGVSEATVSKWRKKYNWDESKDYIESAPHRIEKKLLEEMEKLVSGQKATIDADSLSKVKSALAAVRKDINPSVIYSVLKQLDNFTAINFPEHAVKGTEIHRAFLQFSVEAHG